MDSLFAPFCAPAWALLGMEPMRSALEFASMKCMDSDRLPQGDGHTVVIFPGLATDESSIEPLKSLCRKLGYRAHAWGRGMNTGPSGDFDAWLHELADHVVDHPKRKPGDTGGISLIGWSLGGIYAREVARLRPDAVRHVITIGTPIAGQDDDTHAGWFFRMMNGNTPVLDEALAARLRQTPPVPTTSIYSRSDGVVAWQACRENDRNPQAENIEVESSHMGLAWNPAVLAVVADRLSQPQGAWRRFQAAPARAGFSALTLSGAPA